MLSRRTSGSHSRAARASVPRTRAQRRLGTSRRALEKKSPKRRVGLVRDGKRLTAGGAAAFLALRARFFSTPQPSPSPTTIAKEQSDGQGSTGTNQVEQAQALHQGEAGQEESQASEKADGLSERPPVQPTSVASITARPRRMQRASAGAARLPCMRHVESPRLHRLIRTARPDHPNLRLVSLVPLADGRVESVALDRCLRLLENLPTARRPRLEASRAREEQAAGLP
jgi:hypothetical protein